MRGRGRHLLALASAALVAVVAVAAAGGATSDVARAGGVQVDLPDGWSRVSPSREAPSADPRTLLVVGTDGVRAIQSDCQVASYRVPADGAVLVVIGWRDAVGGTSFLPLSGMKLRRGTFECFSGRGAVGRVTRRDRDLQVNVMVGDRASADTIAAALDAARSVALAPRT